jgi:hypothetical protein
MLNQLATVTCLIYQINIIFKILKWSTHSYGRPGGGQNYPYGH